MENYDGRAVHPSFETKRRTTATTTTTTNDDAHQEIQKRKKLGEREKNGKRGIVSKGNKQGIGEERKEKKNSTSTIDIICQGTEGAPSVFHVAMLSSLSSPALICDSTPDATVLALTGDVGEPVCVGGG